MYQRSCDSFLGVTFNIASSALLLSIVAKLTGYTPRWFTHFLADAHIYVNHFDAVNEQLLREPLHLPTLQLSDRDWTIDTIEPTDIELINYQHHPTIKAPMAI
jgi:thymidylate synthase